LPDPNLIKSRDQILATKRIIGRLLILLLLPFLLD
jgi:hypothetical protein